MHEQICDQAFDAGNVRRWRWSRRPSSPRSTPRPTTIAPPPSSDKARRRRSSEVRPGIEDAAFAKGYRAAYATIYDRNDYAAAIAQLKALGRDDSAAVANLIGYSYRKLGDYKVSQIWYERALKADPNHVKTWQYYGLWQVEQGNRDQAQYHLNRIAALSRHRQRGISLARRRARKAARHRPGLLSAHVIASECEAIDQNPAQIRRQRIAPASRC